MTDLLQPLDLVGLYRVKRLTEHAQSKIGSALTQTNEEQVEISLDGLRRAVEQLNGQFVDAAEVIEIEGIISQICAEREEYEETASCTEDSWQDQRRARAKLTNNIEGVSLLKEIDKAALRFIQSDKTGKLQKAKLYLQYGTFPETNKDDVEALLYLRSRGTECRQQQADFVDHWETFISKNRWNSGYGIIRAAEHCHVPDIEQWWEKWFDRFDQRVDRRSMDKIKAALTFFDLCRSKHAVRIFTDDHTKLWNHTISFFNELYFDPTDEREGLSPIIIASTLFAAQMTASQFVSVEMLEESLKTLMQQQSRDGGWAYSQRMRNKLSVLSTAIAIHALAALKPTGWQEIVGRAVAWLKKVQYDFGFWSDIHFKNHVYLTVLVLDAINLAEGKDEELTFQFGRLPDRQLSIKHLAARESEDCPPFKEKRRGRGRGRRYSDKLLERVEALYNEYSKSYSKAEAWHKAAQECNFESGDAAKMQVRRHVKNRTQ